MDNITVIVVTFNGKPWIEKCLDSILESSVSIKIIVIDNASTDGTQKIIEEKFTQVRFIKLNENLGFGKANNIGLSMAFTDGCDFVFLLNQDAWVVPDTIQKICELHRNNPEYGIISPIHLAEEGKVVDRTFLSYISEKKYNSMISDIIVGSSINQLYPFPFINAAIWSVSRKCLEAVGGFDPVFSHYGEDSDYCNRVSNKNYKIGAAPFIKAIHNRSQSPSRAPINSKTKLFINYLLVFKNENKSLFKISVLHCYYTLNQIFFSALKFKFGFVYDVIIVNLKLLKNMNRIQKSRKEQTDKLAFIHE